MDLRIVVAFSLLAVATALRANFWQSSMPGELLNALDTMTIDDIKSRSSTSTETPKVNTTSSTTSTSSPKRRSTKSKPAQLKSHPIARKRMITSEENSAASTSVEADDYEREYEQFVRNYFDDAANHYLSNDEDESNESAETTNLSSDISYEADTSPIDAVPYGTSAKSAKKSSKKCRKVRRKRESCLICKNLRNGERSETCSYERASEPESYAYETQRKYRKTRDRENSQSTEDDDGETDDSTQAETSKENIAESQVKSETIKPDRAVNTTPASSSCIKRTINGESCYYCKDAIGTQAVKCFNLNTQQKTRDRKKIPLKTNNNTHQKRRIYKRTLSYVYEKGLDSNETITSPEELNGNITISSK